MVINQQTLRWGCAEVREKVYTFFLSSFIHCPAYNAVCIKICTYQKKHYLCSTIWRIYTTRIIPLCKFPPYPILSLFFQQKIESYHPTSYKFATYIVACIFFLLHNVTPPCKINTCHSQPLLFTTILTSSLYLFSSSQRHTSMQNKYMLLSNSLLIEYPLRKYVRVLRTIRKGSNFCLYFRPTPLELNPKS